MLLLIKINLMNYMYFKLLLYLYNNRPVIKFRLQWDRLIHHNNFASYYPHFQTLIRNYSFQRIINFPFKLLFK